MSKINGIIGDQGFERVRDRIAQILLDELANQVVLTYDTDLVFDRVYVERMVPFDHQELSTINVGIERGDYSNQHQGQATGTYRFFIEVNTGGLTKDDGTRGDTASKMRNHKILGKCRAIIEDPVYKTLDFAAGELIEHRHVESFVFAEPTRMDAENVTASRLIVVVRLVETSELLAADVVAVAGDTHVKLYDTDKGYYWSEAEDIVVALADDSGTEILTSDEDEPITP